MKVVVFGFDASENSQVRRIRSLVDAGCDVTAFTMCRRDGPSEDAQPWRNIHLFQVAHERLFRRIWVLAASCLKIAGQRREFRGASVILARNLDMLALAHFARFVSRERQIPIVYECLDVHGSLTRKTRAASVLRAAERWLLTRTQLLVVSSPGFIENYFKPAQKYLGPVHLLENKIWFDEQRPSRRVSAANIADAQPWIIGWVGSLRCEPSFALLLETARRLGDRVRIEMHGQIHAHAVQDFEARTAPLPNIRYHGAYRYPDGLAAIYGPCDFVWAQDLWQAGANSDWLLPNRIYEAGYFGCLSIAVARTQTGQKIISDCLGYVVPEPSVDALVTLLDGLDPAEVEARRAQLLAHQDDRFIQSRGDIEAMLAAALTRS